MAGCSALTRVTDRLVVGVDTRGTLATVLSTGGACAVLDASAGDDEDDEDEDEDDDQPRRPYVGRRLDFHSCSLADDLETVGRLMLPLRLFRVPHRAEVSRARRTRNRFMVVAC